MTKYTFESKFKIGDVVWGLHDEESFCSHPISLHKHTIMHGTIDAIEYHKHVHHQSITYWLVDKMPLGAVDARLTFATKTAAQKKLLTFKVQ